MMNVHLLYPESNDHASISVPNWEDLVRDLGLGLIIQTMGATDKFFTTVVTEVMSKMEVDPKIIKYRQAVVLDTIKSEDIVKEIYGIPLKVRELKKKNWLGVLGVRTPSNVLNGARVYLEILIDGLVELRDIAVRARKDFQSEGFRSLFDRLLKELTDDYIAAVRSHLEKLKFIGGVRIGASMGAGCELTDLSLVSPKRPDRRRFFERSKKFTYRLNPRDEAGARFLEDLKSLSLQSVARVVACACEALENFFNRLQYELAFYLGAARLARVLSDLGLPICYPEPLAEGHELEIYGLYDPSLAILKRGHVVQNSVSHEGKRLYFVMGANKGGKTTFLRSIGLAQLMMQAGLFVAASSARIPVASGIFTHFRRSEDRTLERGKFEEELQRIGDIVRLLKNGSVLLMNESFSSTNEYEASDVAYEILRALLDSGVKVFYVTHMHTLATKFLGNASVVFLEAERRENGERTFRILESKPTSTSYAIEMYRKLIP